jgi:hypothetical protein
MLLETYAVKPFVCYPSFSPMSYWPFFFLAAEMHEMHDC